MYGAGVYHTKKKNWVFSKFTGDNIVEAVIRYCDSQYRADGTDRILKSPPKSVANKKWISWEDPRASSQ